MLVSEFLKTIYVGDRACKSITLDGLRKRVIIQVDEISRIRSVSGLWDYYNDENIVDGLLVFSEVESILFEPAGPIPNDYISSLEEKLLPNGYHRIALSIGSVNDSAESTEVKVIIDAKRVHLEDPSKPMVVIDN